MPNSDAFEYKKFWGGVMRFLGIFRKVEKPAAGLKKVPGYIKLGRSEAEVPRRSCEEGFGKKLRGVKKLLDGAKFSVKILLLKVGPRHSPSDRGLHKIHLSATYREVYIYSVSARSNWRK